MFIIIYLDDILIYTKDQGKNYVEVIQLVLDLLMKNSLFADIKKYRFYKNKQHFLVQIVLS